MTPTLHDSETPAHNQQVFTACAFIYHHIDDIPNVFLPKRAQTKKFLPGAYELPGGHINFGEDMVTGLKREIREEFGVDIKVGEPFYVFTYFNPIKGSHTIEVIYFAQFVSPLDQITLNLADHDSYVWADLPTAIDLFSKSKGTDDQELPAIHKGFDFLAGKYSVISEVKG
jgi:8-oxo-dGTP diphosphatase